MNPEYLDDEEGDCDFTRDKMYGVHRCQEMIEYENSRNKDKTNPILFRKFYIRYSEGGWNLYDRKVKGMTIVQCPFCHKQMFAGNQVVIE